MLVKLQHFHGSDANFLESNLVLIFVAGLRYTDKAWGIDAASNTDAGVALEQPVSDELVCRAASLCLFLIQTLRGEKLHGISVCQNPAGFIARNLLQLENKKVALGRRNTMLGGIFATIFPGRKPVYL